MSEQSALQELANFVARSSLASDDMAARNRALTGMTGRMLPRKRSVSDLLAAVMVLSARTRRMGQDPVHIDLDVFAPGGHRALRIYLGKRSGR